jgi:hypothetical protein
MGANALKILKRDAVGRVSYRAEQREAILEEFERSGLKGGACGACGDGAGDAGDRPGVRASLMRLC